MGESEVKTKNGVKNYLISLCKESWQTSWELIKITVPVAILTKVLEELGLIGYLSMGLEPVMSLLGMPGELGLVWASAMLTNLYGGVAVFATLAPGLELTSAQITVLCSVMLIAHSLPVELSVSKRAGAALMPILLLRLVGAFVYGFILHRICATFRIWQQVPELIFKGSPDSESAFAWGVSLLLNQGLIVLIIFCIIVCMRIFKAIGLLALMERGLAPVLPKFGMGAQAAPITVVGMVMGIGYGGALIIRETSTGKMDRREIFNSMALMGLCHGLVEDTLVMAAIGGKFGGILWGRIVFSLIIAYCIAQLLQRLGEKTAKTNI